MANRQTETIFLWIILLQCALLSVLLTVLFSLGESGRWAPDLAGLFLAGAAFCSAAIIICFEAKTTTEPKDETERAHRKTRNKHLPETNRAA